MVRLISRRDFTVHDSSDDLSEAEDWIGIAAKTDRRGGGDQIVVSFVVTFASGNVYGRKRGGPLSVSLYQDRGIRASTLQGHLDAAPSLRSLLRALVSARQDVSELGEITRVEMTATPPRPDTRQRAA